MILSAYLLARHFRLHQHVCLSGRHSRSTAGERAPGELRRSIGRMELDLFDNGHFFFDLHRSLSCFRKCRTPAMGSEQVHKRGKFRKEQSKTATRQVAGLTLCLLKKANSFCYFYLLSGSLYYMPYSI